MRRFLLNLCGEESSSVNIVRLELWVFLRFAQAPNCKVSKSWRCSFVFVTFTSCSPEDCPAICEGKMNFSLDFLSFSHWEVPTNLDEKCKYFFGTISKRENFSSQTIANDSVATNKPLGPVHPRYQFETSDAPDEFHIHWILSKHTLFLQIKSAKRWCDLELVRQRRSAILEFSSEFSLNFGIRSSESEPPTNRKS